MKHREITHRTVEKIMFGASMLFFTVFGIACLLTGMPLYVWSTMLVIPAVIGLVTFLPPCQGAVQAYVTVACLETAATVYALSTNSLSVMQEAFLLILCLAALYRRIGLTVSQIVYVTLLYATAYLLAPARIFAQHENSFEEITRMVLFYIGSAAVIMLIACFRSAIRLAEMRSQSVTDLYEEVAREKQKAEAGTREKDDFLANMSHEMRTPMIAVCGMSELLLQNDLTPLEEEYVRTIQNSASNLLSMVNDILDFSKIEANMMDLDEAPYHIESLVADVANIINVRVGEKNVAFIAELDPNMPATLIGDEVRIRQILINLLNNAVKFTDEGMVKLTIDYSMDEWNHSWLTIVVKDTGIGITREDQKRLFSQFTQVDHDHKRSIQGTGLGLVISQRLANKMNGNITLESEYGKGSAFTATIEQRVATPAELATVPAPDGYLAYLYEPNPHYFDSMKRMLSRLGISVVTVSDIATWDYYNADRAGAMLFFDYAAGIAGVNAFATKLHKMRLVTMISHDTFVEAGIKDNILLLHKPILTGQLAALIRGENLDDFRRDKKLRSHIYIPDARILVVDDNYVNLRVTAGLLGIFKPEVVMVNSGREAYELLKEDRSFDLIFMDHMMPDWDGVETVIHIRALEDDYYKNVPIIALSANVSQEAREMFLREGMNDFVGKPMSTDTLSTVLKKYIAPEKQLNEYTEKVDPMMTVSRPRDEYISAAATGRSCNIDIPGLDTARGVFNMGGNADDYLKILSVFLKDGRIKVNQMEKDVKSGHFDSYGRESHSLRSVAASIGAASLSELAKQHEKAARDGETEFIRQHYATLLSQYADILNAVEQYLTVHHLLEPQGQSASEDERHWQPISARYKRECLDEIIGLTERFVGDEAVDKIHELQRCQLEPHERAALQRAEGQLTDYLFEEALQTLKTI
ncbi:MAG: response regulator [Clostridia bacterium]|nr:response regulator [Clostridia bacterium]